MARRIEAAGGKLYLDIHYSDFWADPQHQDIPAAWQGQDLPQLTNTVRAYTQSVIKAFAAQHTPVDMVSIGNEIRNGILWPVGQVDWSADTGWDNLTTLLQSGGGRRAPSQPGRSQAPRDAPLRRGRQQRRQRPLLRPHGLAPASRST